MEVGYGVVWREGGVEQAGRLTLCPHSILFTPFERDVASVREVALDQVVGAELRRTDPDTRRVSLVLTLGDDSRLELESAVDKWIASSLLENVFAHVLGEVPDRRQIALAVKLKPGRRDAARELLRGGPPFDPALTSLVFHGVFLLDDEVLFVFETRGGDELEKLLEFDAWAAVATWREVSTGEVRLAEQAYSWTGTESVPGRTGRIGLGL